MCPKDADGKANSADADPREWQTVLTLSDCVYTVYLDLFVWKFRIIAV